MKVSIINPNLIVNPIDKFTTGIVYLPILIASISACLKKNNIDHKVIDLFGANPSKVKKYKSFYFFGESVKKYEREILESDVIFIYANQVINHLSVIKIKSYVRECNSKAKIFILENTQAVTGYSLKDLHQDFLESNNDFILIGEAEEKIIQILNFLKSNSNLISINGLIGKNFSNPSRELISDLDSLPIPDWSHIPLNNYWNLKHAHGPLSNKKYLSVLTSRGCPYPCKFCVVPETNNRRWRFKSPKKVVDEIEYYQKNYSINEFHFEDLNPTVNDIRTREICKEIIRRNLKINWKIVSGTKVESIKNNDTVDLMAQSGCKYVSISPESGSKDVMKNIGKPFNLDHAYKIVKRMNEKKIFSQACFVLGFPDENEDDILKTKQMIYKLTKNGVDEIAIFIITPIPGSSIFEKFKGYNSFSELNFSPHWRKDYKYLANKRFSFYIYFLFFKSIYYPKKILLQCINFLRLKFNTKMEMVPYKFLRINFFIILRKFLN
jgi:tRNA A37 methylthiotransferase MiaB